ncbi:MAG: PKD domain-containing protein [Propionicimonas sp.]
MPRLTTAITTATTTIALTLGVLVMAAPTARAAAPATPVLVAPANGSTAANVDVPLSVSVTDPDGDALDVRFEGRKAGATVPGTGTGDPFTIVALPDLQNYTYNNRQATIVQQAQWAVNTRTALNTAMVVQLGDLVSEYNNPAQWERTSTGLQVLDDARIPNTVVAGNHDFDNATGGFAEYDTWFPPSRYANQPWTPGTASYGGYLGQNLFGPDPVDRRNMDNFALFSAAGRDFLMLNLEWETPQYSLDWAAKVLAAYPDRIAILSTHSFVQINGTRRTVPQRPGGIAAETAWSTFVSQQCSIKLVLSGHYHQGDLGEANRSDLNRCGNPVQQILTDYQDRANGGDGWLRYYTFNPTAGTMTATTYSPKLDQYETDADSAFTLPFDLGTAQPAPFTAIATTQVASGGTAATTWTGLELDQPYEWRVVVSDGTSSTTSPTWTVRTPPSADLVDDTFTRNVSNGWGAASASQAWVTRSTATSYSVDGSLGRITTPLASGRGATLTGLSAADVRITTETAMTQAATGSGAYMAVMGRVQNNNSYRAKLTYSTGGGLALTLVRYVGSETNLVKATLAGITATAGLKLRLRLELEGSAPTTLRAKAWRADATEPAAWTLTTSDGTAGLQTAGSAGVDVYTSGTAAAPSVLTFDRFTVSPLGGTPPPVNQSPTAVIGTPTITDLVIGLSGSGSTDSDGTISSYAWNFGDTTTGTGVTTTHTYAAAGTYTVTLTVTDDDGATGTTTRQVTVTAAPPGNVAPTAVIGTPTITDLVVGLSGSGSTDTDGTINGYAWNFGDTTTGTGVTTTHTYLATGTYTVTLTVTDDAGATGTTTRQVSVTAPATGPLAQDAFGRTTSNGWGSATVGGAWSVTGAASRYAVAGGTGQQVITAVGTTTYAALTGVSATAIDLRGKLAWSRTAAAGSLYAYVVPRRLDANNDYRCKVVVNSAGAMQLNLVRRVAGAETNLTSLTVPGLTQAANQTYSFACRVLPSGPGTQVTGKLWRSGTTEPASWQVTSNDSTSALQGAGSVGISAYLSSTATAGITLSVDDLVATDPNA